MNVKTIWSLLQKAFADWNEHEGPRLGAALAFYTLLSLAPLLILGIALIALVFGPSAPSHWLDELGNIIGSQGSQAMKGMIAQDPRMKTGKVASLAGIVTLLIGASGVFGELRSALNTMWDVKASGNDGFWAAVKQRLFALGLVLAAGFLVVVSLVISSLLAASGKFFHGILPMPAPVLSVLDFIISFAGITASFAFIFRYVADATMGWKTAWIGAATTAALFTVGKILIALYLGKAALGSAYGAAGSLVVMIVWVYYSAMIFFFGAELTHQLDLREKAATPGTRA